MPEVSIVVSARDSFSPSIKNMTNSIKGGTAGVLCKGYGRREGSGGDENSPRGGGCGELFWFCSGGYFRGFWQFARFNFQGR